MLKLLVRNNDICKVSKLLVRNKIKAQITNSIIVIGVFVSYFQLINCKTTNTVSYNGGNDNTDDNECNT